MLLSGAKKQIEISDAETLYGRKNRQKLRQNATFVQSHDRAGGSVQMPVQAVDG
jgi:hypothetical protein